MIHIQLNYGPMSVGTDCTIMCAKMIDNITLWYISVCLCKAQINDLPHEIAILQ